MKRLFFLLTIISSCKTKLVATTDSSVSKRVAALKGDTTIVLSDKLTLVGRRSEEFNGAAFNRISILSGKKVIFRGRANLYWLSGFTSHQYPKLLSCGTTCQLLLEVDKRPRQNELNQITIANGKRVTQTPLPIFDWIPRNIDNDERLELFGILTNGEGVGNGDTARYNPTLVYELIGNCLALDSSTTKAVNARIWGGFHGYYYNENLILPFNRSGYP